MASGYRETVVNRGVTRLDSLTSRSPIVRLRRYSLTTRLRSPSPFRAIFISCLSVYPHFFLLFVFESFDSTFPNLFPAVAKLLLHWIVVVVDIEIYIPYISSPILRDLYFFLLFVLESFDSAFPNLFPTVAKLLLHLWMVDVVEKSLLFISFPILRDLYSFSYSSSNLSIQRFLIFFEQIIMDRSCREIRCAHFFIYRYFFLLFVFRFNVS